MKNKEPRIIEIEVTAEDAGKAGQYCDRQNCLLGTAIQRQEGLPAKNISVGGYSVDINAATYTIQQNRKMIISCYADSQGKPTVTAPFKVVLREVL